MTKMGKSVACKKCVFGAYMIWLSILGISGIVMAIYSMVDEAITKLRLWRQFDDAFPNLLPLLVLIASVMTLISLIPGFIATCKDNQIVVGVFVCMLLVSALLWFSIGAWCASMQKLMIDDMELEFQRIGEYSSRDSDEEQFLSDLSIHMPRLNNQLNFKCCEGNQKETLNTCSQQCGFNYQELFKVLVFPSVYAVTFGSGFFCLLALIFACRYCIGLDHVNPAF